MISIKFVFSLKIYKVKLKCYLQIRDSVSSLQIALVKTCKFE